MYNYPSYLNHISIPMNTNQIKKNTHIHIENLNENKFQMFEKLDDKELSSLVGGGRPPIDPIAQMLMLSPKY